MDFWRWLSLLAVLNFLNCDNPSNPVTPNPDVNRNEKLPPDITKQSPETDLYPPILLTNSFEQPVPLPPSINTAGAEDSPFILPDGNTLYFFFTPDVRIPPEQQLLDKVSGVWVSRKRGNTWSHAERVWLQEPGKLALDGAVCIQDDKMWFASAREGFTGVNIFTAIWQNGSWIDWQYVGDRLMREIKIGEVHIDENELYFHSDRPGGKGGLDIWKTVQQNGEWSDPINIESVNSEILDGYPFISADGDELWFTRIVNGTPGIFRSVKTDDNWAPPELILSQFAGEPTLDAAGNLYFVHHFFKNDQMIEADIYVAYKKLSLK